MNKTNGSTVDVMFGTINKTINGTSLSILVQRLDTRMDIFSNILTAP